MEIFTSIEFKVDEFSQIDTVVPVLLKEGWVNYNTTEYYLKSPKGKKEIKAKKYLFVRYV